MPLKEKFPIGCLVTGRNIDAPLRVIGYDGLKSVIVQLQEDTGTWKKGWVGIMQTRDLTRREEVKHIEGETEGDDGHAIGWMELGGISVGLTRTHLDDSLLISVELAPEGNAESLRVHIVHKADTLWEGTID